MPTQLCSVLTNGSRRQYFALFEQIYGSPIEYFIDINGGVQGGLQIQFILIKRILYKRTSGNPNGNSFLVNICGNSGRSSDQQNQPNGGPIRLYHSNRQGFNEVERMERVPLQVACQLFMKTLLYF